MPKALILKKIQIKMSKEKRELRRSLKSEIDNLFAAPESAEEDFLLAVSQQLSNNKDEYTERIKRRKLDYGHACTSKNGQKIEETDNSNEPKISLHLGRLGEDRRVDCETIAHLIHYSIFGSAVRKPRWASISRYRKVLQTLVVRVDVEDDFFTTTNLNFLNEFFERRWVELDSDISNTRLFWNSVMTVQLTLQEQVRRKSDIMHEKFETLGKYDKSHFVLSTRQLAEKNFPFPGQEGIVATKRRYKKLSSSSPMFSVDCEMCETLLADRELTRISIVDEGESTILDTLVKPSGDITNYLTRYSGITEKMMEGVTTTLADVQRAVQNLLPPDAILVGHSLEFDLQAMKMSHPYCLDVGYALNLTNCTRGTRNSLKKLTELFLGAKIQTKFGHCSYEDAWAAMRLAQLKLEHGLVFGNTSFGWKYTEYAEKNGIVEKEVTNAEIIATIPCSGCSQPTVVECTVMNCRCRFVSAPSICVHCVKEGESVEGDVEFHDIHEVELIRPSSPINNYLDKDKMKSIMCAFDTTILDSFPINSKKTRSKQPSSFSSYESFLNNVASEMLNDSAIFVQIDKKQIEPRDSTDESSDGESIDNSDALNDILEKLVSATSKNALVMIIISSPNKNILFCRVK